MLLVVCDGEGEVNEKSGKSASWKPEDSRREAGDRNGAAREGKPLVASALARNMLGCEKEDSDCDCHSDSKTSNWRKGLRGSPRVTRGRGGGEETGK